MTHEQQKDTEKLHRAVDELWQQYGAYAWSNSRTASCLPRPIPGTSHESLLKGVIDSLGLTNVLDLMEAMHTPYGVRQHFRFNDTADADNSGDYLDAVHGTIPPLLRLVKNNRMLVPWDRSDTENERGRDHLGLVWAFARQSESVWRNL